MQSKAHQSQHSHDPPAVASLNAGKRTANTGRKKAAIAYCEIKRSPTRNIETKTLHLLNLTD